MIHTGEIDPAYLMFNVFQQRNRERIDYALKLLDTEPDWTLDESFTFDREHAALAGRRRRRWTSCGGCASRTTRSR